LLCFRRWRVAARGARRSESIYRTTSKLWTHSKEEWSVPIEERDRESLGAPGAPPRSTEDAVTITIKRSTAGVPSSLFLAVGLGGMGLSLIVISAPGQVGNFIVHWSDMLITGLHNKLIKVGTIRKIAGPCVGSGPRASPIGRSPTNRRSNGISRGLGTGIGARTAV
jgi:hypothetical protein